MGVKTLEGVYKNLSGAEEGPYTIELETYNGQIVIKLDKGVSEHLKTKVMKVMNLKELKDTLKYKLKQISISFEQPFI